MRRFVKANTSRRPRLWHAIEKHGVITCDRPLRSPTRPVSALPLDARLSDLCPVCFEGLLEQAGIRPEGINDAA